MKQLELTVEIKQVDDPDYPYEITAHPEVPSEDSAWCRGKTLPEVMTRFFELFANENLRYWSILRDA